MENITKKVVKKGQKNIIKKKMMIKKRERQKYKFMPEDEKKVIRQRSLNRYYKIKSR